MAHYEKRVDGRHLVKTVKQLLKRGNVTHIKVSSADGSRVFLNVPVNCMVLVGVLSPLLAGAGFAFALFKSFKVEFTVSNSEEK